MFTFRSDILAAWTWLILRFLLHGSCLAADVLLVWVWVWQDAVAACGWAAVCGACGVVWLWRCGEAGEGGFPPAFPGFGW